MIGYLLVGGLLLALIVLLTYQIRIDTYTRNKLFEIQLEMGKGQAAMTKELPWSDLKKIIDEVIDFTISNYIITNGVTKMSDEELAINWTMMLNDICTEVELALSEPIKHQILKTISEEYMTRYIKNSVQLVIVYRLQNNKKNPVNEKLEKIHKGANSLNIPNNQQ
jgi:hypothetical protein